MAKNKTTTPPSAVYDDKWQVRDDLSTLSRANEILSDKVRFSKVQTEIKKTQEALTKLKGK